MKLLVRPQKTTGRCVAPDKPPRMQDMVKFERRCSRLSCTCLRRPQRPCIFTRNSANLCSYSPTKLPLRATHPNAARHSISLSANTIAGTAATSSARHILPSPSLSTSTPNSTPTAYPPEHARHATVNTNVGTLRARSSARTAKIARTTSTTRVVHPPRWQDLQATGASSRAGFVEAHTPQKLLIAFPRTGIGRHSEPGARKRKIT